MKKSAFDYRFIIGLFLAHVVMYLTFKDKAIFWYMFTAATLFLISYAILHEKTENQASFLSYFLYGMVSGLLIFSLFWVGNFLIDFFHLPFAKGISRLYNSFSPTEIWHYIVLFLIIVPGEELFWRGFIQKRLTNVLSHSYIGVLIASLLYASVQIYSGSFIHFLAALVAGIFWGILYLWKKSMPLIILSHLVFDLFIFILFPFR